VKSPAVTENHNGKYFCPSNAITQNETGRSTTTCSQMLLDYPVQMCYDAGIIILLVLQKVYTNIYSSETDIDRFINHFLSRHSHHFSLPAFLEIYQTTACDCLSS
jgi:hypothetical protein